MKVRRGVFNSDELKMKTALLKKRKKVSNRYLAALCSTCWFAFSLLF
jgi:hypothetical protein